jgi:uncharacterized membrane protein
MDFRHSGYCVLRQACDSSGAAGHIRELFERAAIGPIPGSVVVVAGILFHGGWAVFALITLRTEIASRRERGNLIAMG